MRKSAYKIALNFVQYIKFQKNVCTKKKKRTFITSEKILDFYKHYKKNGHLFPRTLVSLGEALVKMLGTTKFRILLCIWWSRDPPFFNGIVFSLVRVQIGWELVRLITLIDLNKFFTNIISPKSLKKFSHTTFRWCVVRKCSSLVFYPVSKIIVSPPRVFWF